ncbi:MAG: LPS export ABC transporter permease LptF [Marinovum sp.]|nr:LPS export ABC transporter permease LptF [Marinovum sp.]
MFGFFSLILLFIYWINKAIALFDKLISDGQPFLVFLEFSILTIPPIIPIIAPLAAFAAAIFVTNRLKNDSELTIMQATGFSPLRLSRAIFLFGLMVTIILLIISHYLVPKTNNILIERQNEVTSSLNAKLLKVGSFIHPQNSVTFYIGGISNSGIIEDVFVLDERNKDREIIITSKSGYLITNNNNPILVLKDGIVQNYDVKSKNLSTIHFQDLSYDLTSWSVKERQSKAKLLLTYSSFDLFKDPELIAILSDSSPISVIEELHSRILTPFLALIAALIGFSALMIGDYSRFGASKQISVGIIILIFIKLSESYGNEVMLKSQGNWLALYLPILIGILIFSFMMLVASNQKLLGRRSQASEKT